MLSNIDEAARALAMRKSTLRKWVLQRRIPFVRLGRSVRFNITECLEFFKNKTKSE